MSHLPRNNPNINILRFYVFYVLRIFKYDFKLNDVIQKAHTFISEWQAKGRHPMLVHLDTLNSATRHWQ